MQHVVAHWQHTEDGMVEVWFSVGPSATRLRRIEPAIVCHPAEWNAIDRLLTVGSVLERPELTYHGIPPEGRKEPAPESERARRETWRARHQLPEGLTRERLLERTW